MTKGFIQVYTGNGKGKTTAAIGLAIRAAGAGLPVYFAQFVKGQPCSELCALKRYSDLITVCQFGRMSFIDQTATQEDIDAARTGLAQVEVALQSKKYRLVILDEANIAVYYNIFSVNELLRVIGTRSPDCEIVITGRNAPQEIIDAADLVTEMKEIKHYFNEGVAARIGIEK
jgi:cob(I)alamin adenosyltransferase